MSDQTVVIGLPEALYRDAQELGVLEQRVLIALIQQEVDRRVMALVNAEIQAHRMDQSQEELDDKHLD